MNDVNINKKEKIDAIFNEIGVSYKDFKIIWKNICNARIEVSIKEGEKTYVKKEKIKLSAQHFIFYNLIRGFSKERGFIPESKGYLEAKTGFEKLNQNRYAKNIFISKFDGFLEKQKVEQILEKLN